MVHRLLEIPIHAQAHQFIRKSNETALQLFSRVDGLPQVHVNVEFHHLFELVLDDLADHFYHLFLCLLFPSRVSHLFWLGCLQGKKF